MERILDRIRRARRPPFHTMSPAEARELYEAGAELLEPPRAPVAEVRDIVLPAADGTRLRARFYAAESGSARPVLLFLHGGGFVIGNLETHDSLCRQLALQSGVAVLALDYRLAPEHRFPVAVDDVWAAMHWLRRAGAVELDIDPRRIAVGGDSAGGTLAAVAALHARDAGMALALQLLITPGTASDAAHASHRTYGQGYLLEAESIAWFFDHYIARADRGDWRFAPLEADNVDGVAPACVILAECDPLVDEGLAYADRLRAAGVAVELELYRGVTHDFIKLGRLLPEAGTAKGAAAAALRRAFGGNGA
jgi:acetyl esterase